MKNQRTADRLFARRVFIQFGNEGTEALADYARRRERDGFWSGFLTATMIAIVVVSAWPWISEGLRQVFGVLW